MVTASSIKARMGNLSLMLVAYAGMLHTFPVSAVLLGDYPFFSTPHTLHAVCGL